MLIGVASSFWSAASCLTRSAYRAGILKSRDLGVRVISVGNIQAGGAGKTPLVIRIAREALQKKLKVCILTRGYKGQWEKVGGILLPGDAADPTICGDEPALLHEQLPEAVIGIGANRVKSFDRVVERFGRPDLVVLDDGLQHWKIKKDIEVVALTSATPDTVVFRESERALTFASLLVWTKGQRCPTELPHAKIHLKLPRAEAGKDRIWLVTGVGDPGSVRQSAEAAGYTVVHQEILTDHATYSEAELERFGREAKHAQAWLATTGKDWVKWKHLGNRTVRPLVLEPEVNIESGRELWNRVLWES